MNKCELCGQEYEGDAIVIDGQVICPHCLETECAPCDDCGVICLKDNMRTTYDGRLICEDCFGSNYFICEDCEQVYPVDMAVTVNECCWDERVVCEDCVTSDDNYARCDSCGEWYTSNHISLSDHGRTHSGIRNICDGCEDDYVICENCGDIVPMDEAEWCEEDDCYRCSRCHDECVIRSYGYKPDPIFGTLDPCTDGLGRYNGTALTFGVELECDKGRDPEAAARAVQALTDRLYIKHDGSLSNGYEVVTHPGTLAWHTEKFPWADVCKVSLDHGFKSHDAQTCGLHIHIGNNQFGQTWKQKHAVGAKLAVLCDVLWPEIEQFSRRGRGGCDHWASRNDCLRGLRYGMDEETAVDALYNYASNDRYKAVNLTNAYTVELRFNRGTLKHETILASLQLASNLTKFAMSHTVNECIDAKWSDILAVDTYAALDAYVKERFADFTPNEDDRVKARIRVGDVRPAHERRETGNSIEDFFEWEFIEDSGVAPQRGDIVRCDNIPADMYNFTDATEVEDCIGVHISYEGNVWGEGAGGRHLHRNCDPTIDRGQWNVNNHFLSRATGLRNHESIDRNSVWEAIHSWNLLPGDHVFITDNSVTGADSNASLEGRIGTIITFFGHDDYLAARIYWGIEGVGHNGSGFASSSLVNDRSIWNVRVSNLTRV